MKFFDNLFHLSDDNYFGVSGLNTELSCIYIYNAFLKCKKGVVVITNSLYEANLIYSKISCYTDRVLFFPMDDFITSEAMAISPEFKSACKLLLTIKILPRKNAVLDIVRTGAAESEETIAFKVEYLSAHKMKNRVSDFVCFPAVKINDFELIVESVKVLVIAVNKYSSETFIVKPF